MPSYARQGLRVIKRKNPKNNGSYILISKRTGFLDVWVNGKHYYYNYVQHNVDPRRIDLNKIISDIEADEQKKRGVIVIKRK